MSYTYKDNSKAVLDALQRAKKRGLTAIGMEAEAHAKKVLSDAVYVGDKPYKLTGRLRNSITFAISGQKANISSYRGDDNEPGGTYEGTAPEDKDMAVYVGTGVSYAEGIETGSHRKAGPVHFLRKAATEPKERFKQLLKEAMENA